MTMTDPQPGTFFTVRTPGLAGALIRLGTRSQHNHAGVVLSDGRTVEAQPHGARVGHLHADRSRYAFNDQQPLTQQQRGDIVAVSVALLGTPYNWLDIAALALSSLGIRWRWLLRRVEREDRLVCSQLCDLAYSKAGVHLYRDGRPHSSVTPGDLLLLTAQHGWDQTPTITR